MSALGTEIDTIWDAVVAEVATVQYSSESINAVKGRLHAMDPNPRVYVMLGPCTLLSGNKTIRYWQPSFVILIFYANSNIAVADAGAQKISGDITTALENNRQLGGLVQTLLVQNQRPQVYPGFERANAQLQVTARFSHTLSYSPATSVGQDIQADFGSEQNDIIDWVETEVAKVTGLNVIYQTNRDDHMLDANPTVVILLTNVSTDQWTTQKTLTKLSIDIAIYYADTLGGEVQALTYAGAVADQFGDDYRLASRVEAAEPVAIIPNWRGESGLERSCMATRLEVLLARRA